MILDVLELLLTPVILVMEIIFGLFLSISGSASLSIILLSLMITIMAHPLRAWAQAVETRVHLRIKAVDTEIAASTVGLKGEPRFRAVEKVYQTHNYHPIYSVALGTPLIIMLPVLLSALFLFTSNPDLTGESFVFVSDLSQPDGLLWGLNLLPVIMTCITLVDSKIRFGNDRAALVRFLIIAVVMFVLVYGFASAIVVFWATSNLVAMLSHLLQRS